jgi:hypothetical protein
LSSFPRSPRLVKGAIVGVDIFNPLASIIVFQYNPETMTRTLQAQASGPEGGSRSEPMRLKGAPIESISMAVEIDATDQLEQGSGLTGELGIYPQLSALEMLLYPKSALVIANTVLAATGTIEIIGPEAPFTLLIWGIKRVLPVRLTGFSISEEAYDPNLNPIRAKVSLNLRVLSYDDFPLTHPGYYVFLAHQVAKEVMATISSVQSVAGAASASFSLSAGT